MVGGAALTPMRSLPLLLTAAVTLLACQTREARQSPPQAPQRVETPPTTAPADISHGEAPIGSAEQPAPIDPRAPSPAPGAARLQRIRVVIRHAKVSIADGVTYGRGRSMGVYRGRSCAPRWVTRWISRW